MQEDERYIGEYIIYYRGKVVGGIYDDRFLVKNIKTAADLLYPGFPSEPAPLALHFIGRLTAPIMWFFHVYYPLQANVSNMEYEWMNPATSGVIHMLSIIVAKVICIFGNKDSDRKLDKAALPYVVLPVFSVLFFMVDGNRFLQGDNEYNLSQYTEMVVILVLINILVFAFLEKHTVLMKQEIEARQNEYKLKSDAYIMSLATRTMKERLAVSEEIMQQDRVFKVRMIVG